MARGAGVPQNEKVANGTIAVSDQGATDFYDEWVPPLFINGEIQQGTRDIQRVKAIVDPMLRNKGRPPAKLKNRSRRISKRTSRLASVELLRSRSSFYWGANDWPAC